MFNSKYDAIAHDYDNIVNDKEQFGNGPSVVDIAAKTLNQRLSNIDGISLLDLGCGTGTLSIEWAKQGAKVTAIDLSIEMLKVAQSKAGSERVKWIQDDAQALQKIADESFQFVLSNLVMMDVPDLLSVYRAVYRVLSQGGHFAFTIMHPCFQSPHAEMLQQDGKFVGYQISQYAQEGHWKSDFARGIRGQVGAYHRTISTYINELISTGFRINYIAEPTTTEAYDPNPRQQMFKLTPVVMLIEAYKTEI